MRVMCTECGHSWVSALAYSHTLSLSAKNATEMAITLAPEVHGSLCKSVNERQPQLDVLAALTRAKGCIIGMEGARRWALNELGSAIKEAMNGEQVALEGDSPAARQALATSTRPQCADLLALCDSPGKRQCLQRELEE